MGGAVDDVDFDGRALAHAQHRLVVEIALLHAAVDDIDAAMQRGRQTEDDGALHLLAHDVGVHRQAAVDDADDAVHADALVGARVGADRDFGDLRHHAAKGMVQGHATSLDGAVIGRC